MRYVYLYSELGGCFTVGFYTPSGHWEPESDHSTSEAAARRVHYLNGGEIQDEYDSDGRTISDADPGL